MTSHLFSSRPSLRLLWPSLSLMACLGCSSHVGKEHSQPGLVVLDSELHDFGERNQGEVLTHTFSLVNRSSVPLKIAGLETSCNCVVARLSGTLVEPERTLAVPVHFTTGGSQEAASARVNVHYRAVDAPQSDDRSLGLRLQARVRPDYRISPDQIDFGVIDGLAIQQVSHTVRIAPEAVADIRILRITPPAL